LGGQQARISRLASGLFAVQKNYGLTHRHPFQIYPVGNDIAGHANGWRTVRVRGGTVNGLPATGDDAENFIDGQGMGNSANDILVPTETARYPIGLAVSYRIECGRFIVLSAEISAGLDDAPGSIGNIGDPLESTYTGTTNLLIGTVDSLSLKDDLRIVIAQNVRGDLTAELVASDAWLNVGEERLERRRVARLWEPDNQDDGTRMQWKRIEAQTSGFGMVRPLIHPSVDESLNDCLYLSASVVETADIPGHPHLNCTYDHAIHNEDYETSTVVTGDCSSATDGSLDDPWSWYFYYASTVPICWSNVEFGCDTVSFDWGTQVMDECVPLGHLTWTGHDEIGPKLYDWLKPVFETYSIDAMNWGEKVCHNWTPYFGFQDCADWETAPNRPLGGWMTKRGPYRSQMGDPLETEVHWILARGWQSKIRFVKRLETPTSGAGCIITFTYSNTNCCEQEPSDPVTVTDIQCERWKGSELELTQRVDDLESKRVQIFEPLSHCLNCPDNYWSEAP
jgi:hypothetical protein